MTSDPQFTDLNAAFGKALLQQFFEPMLTGRGPNGEPYYAPSGVSLMAQELFRNHSRLIMDEVWERLDMEDLASKIAELVVKELTRSPNGWGDRNIHRDELVKRVKEVAAQQLGQRVVDRMDVHLGPKELPE